MKQLYVLLFMLMLLAVNMVFGQSFTTKVSSTVIGKKDVLQVEYVAENLELQELVLPVFKGWSILSGPNFSSNRLQTGNIVKQQIIYSLTLEPQATGKLIVPGAKATIENKTRLSNNVSVEVKNEAHLQGNSSPAPRFVPPTVDDTFEEEQVNDEQVLKKGENARDKIQNNLMVKVEVNKKSAYVGEPILVTYKLCTRIRSQSRVIKQPAFSGCTVLEMTSDDALPRKEMINGKRFNVYIIRQVQLIPLQAGVLELPAASVENAVTFYRAGQVNYRDLFYNTPTGKPEELTVVLKNAPVQIDIKPLPVPAPADFAGAIGNFGLEVRSINADDNATGSNALLVVITGEGNLQLTKTPQVEWPNGLEGFEATEQEQLNKTVYPAEVRKTFTYPFVAAKSGNYVIPPLRFSYFDPVKNSYQSLASQPLRINVQKASKIFVQRDGQEHSKAFYTRLYVLLGAALLVVLFGLLWYHRTNKPVVVTKTSPSPAPEAPPAPPQPDCDQFVYEIRQLDPGGEGPAFYRQLHKSISAWLSARFGLSLSELDQYSEQYPGRAMGLQQLASILKACSIGMYTPLYNIEEAIQHRQLALEAINTLEKES